MIHTYELVVHPHLLECIQHTIAAGAKLHPDLGKVDSVLHSTLFDFVMQIVSVASFAGKVINYL